MEMYINASEYVVWYREEYKWAMTIRSKVPSKEYKENYDKIFGKKFTNKKPKKELS